MKKFVNPWPMQYIPHLCFQLRWVPSLFYFYFSCHGDNEARKTREKRQANRKEGRKGGGRLAEVPQHT